MKARLVAFLTDLLLGCFTLLIPRDRSPGIRVSTLSELAAALLCEDEYFGVTGNTSDVTLIDHVEIHSEEGVIEAVAHVAQASVAAGVVVEY